MEMKILSGLILLLIPLCLMAQVPMQPPQAEAITDSVSQSREQEILIDYGFRDLDTLTSVAKKLQIRDVNRWKAAMGLEPANKTLDGKSLRRLEISPYRAFLAKQTVEYGYNELNTISEIAGKIHIPVKKLKALLGNENPLEKSWDHTSIQALHISPSDVKKAADSFEHDVLLYGGSVTLVGMIVVFVALLLTSIIISQLVHLNAKPKAAVIKLDGAGKIKAAPKDLSRNVIVAAITALHMHASEIEEQRKMVLTFRRTPTNQWRASAVLSMPNRELKRR